MIVANTFGSFALLLVMGLGGFVLTKGCFDASHLNFWMVMTLLLNVTEHFISSIAIIFR